MKKIIPFLLAVFLLTACSVNSENGVDYMKISMNDAVEMMARESDYIILDVRTVEEYNERHIPGAINIPNETIGSTEIPELPDKQQLIMVYCRSGNRSKTASDTLVKLGYTNVYEFGGIITWPYETE